MMPGDARTVRDFPPFGGAKTTVPVHDPQLPLDADQHRRWIEVIDRQAEDLTLTTP